MAAKGNSSKNSRTTGIPGNGKYQLAADMSLIMPLNSGKHAYLIHPADGRTLHLQTSSDAFTTAVAEVCGLGYGDRVRSDLERLSATYPQDGWDTTLSRLAESGAFATA